MMRKPDGFLNGANGQIEYEGYFHKDTSVKVVLIVGLVAAFLALSLTFAPFMDAPIPGAISQAGIAASNNTTSTVSPPAPSNMAGMSVKDAISYGIVDESSSPDIIDDNMLMPYFELIGNNDRTSRFYTKGILDKPAILPPSTATPSITPTPTSDAQFVPKYPVEILWDSPYKESIKPIQNYDRKYLRSCDMSYKFDAGPLLVDPQGTNMGSTYAYPGDTIGMMLRLYNNGKPIDTAARVDISLSKYNNGQWTDDLVKLHYDMPLRAGDDIVSYKNVTINVPSEVRESGFYRLYLKFYVNGTLSSEMSKEFNVL